MNQKRRTLLYILIPVVLIGLCLGLILVTLGSGLTLWFAVDGKPARPSPTPRLIRRLASNNGSLPASPTPPAPAAAPSLPPTTAPPPPPPATPPPTSTPQPPTATPQPPTATPQPPTATPQPTPSPRPPTATPEPSAPPGPTFSFTILETQQFPTNHLDFDVFIAITDPDNKPLSGYQVLGQHSSGLQLASQTSAGNWTANSGAMHYKAGNIKYSSLNSPGGVWTLQLVDQAGAPAAPPLELPFDSSDPVWYFILYQRLE